MSSVGADLRHARERAQLSLRDLSARTKIRVPLLEAIEQEQFDRLPPGLLTRGYLRAYAREVGLDAEAIVRQYTEQFEPARVPPSQKATEIEWDPEPSVRTRWAILTPAIPLTLAALFFLLMNRGTEIAAPRPVTAPPAVTPIGTTGQQPAAASVADAATHAVAPAERLRLEIYPTGDTWIEASVDGTLVLYELIDAGQRRTLEADREIALLIGDAGAFAYSINDMPGRPLGRTSEVRDIRITRDNASSFMIRD
jgi:cytoskeletal protein RodZ